MTTRDLCRLFTGLAILCAIALGTMVAQSVAFGLANRPAVAIAFFAPANLSPED